MKNIGLALVAAFALSSTQAMAVPFTEVADAGSLVGSAQYAGTNITSISGSTSPGDLQTPGDYEDLFRLSVGDGLFEAATNGLFGSSRDFDTMLFLFDSSGTFITANDDSGSLGSYISATLVAGDYLLGISGFSNDALNGTGEVFRFGATGTLASWEENGATGNYTIGINSTAAVPEPAPLALLALGLTALGLARRKRR